MNGPLQRFLAATIKTGELEVVDSSGKRHRFGDGSGTPVRIRFHSTAAERAVLFDPEMKLGEEYVNGGYDVEAGSILDLLRILIENVGPRGRTWWMTALSGVRHLVRRLSENNNFAHARRNVHRHYDRDGRLYSLFLDDNRQYSCAYFEDGVTSLDEAQMAKMRHLAAKLNLMPGQRVLDIGSGWGGLGLYLAEHFEVDVTGVTVSDEQFTISNQRAKALGLDKHVRFVNQDYRRISGVFDRIVSVGMFEHVGLARYGEFFRGVERLLARDGVAVVHTIAKKDTPGPINPWMQSYIFPGAYLPTLSELAPQIERQGFWLTDLEVWRLHYANTLAAWNQRFQARRAEAAAIFGEPFCRMWEFYFQLCEIGFRYQGLCVFQLQLAKSIDVVPLTRDYVYGGRRRGAERPVAVQTAGPLRRSA
ncbi:MAG: cyclopropane-fatty-acyl-phospholipid synthase family protein [Bauldia sp.]